MRSFSVGVTSARARTSPAEQAKPMQGDRLEPDDVHSFQRDHQRTLDQPDAPLEIPPQAQLDRKQLGQRGPLQLSRGDEGTAPSR